MGLGTIFAVNLDGGNFRTLFNFAETSRVRVIDLFPAGNTLYGVGTVVDHGGQVLYGTVFSLALPGPPQLSLIRSGGSAILSWPANAVGFTLQSTTNLVSPAVWSTVYPAPVVVQGNYTVTNAVSGSQKFYRFRE